MRFRERGQALRPMRPGWNETPPSALVISVLALVVAGIISLLWPDSVEEYAGFVWILALVPVFLLAYHRGWTGAAAAAAGGMVALTLFEVVVNRWLAFEENWYVVGGAAVVLIAVTIGAGWLSERLIGVGEEERRIHELAPVPILVHTRRALEYANRAALRLLGVEEPREIIGESPLKMIHPEDRDRFRERVEDIYETGGLAEPGRERLRIVRPDGRTRTTEVDSIPVLYGQERAVQTIIRDITERARMERQLERRALYDPLTELPNRHLFEDRAKQAIARARRRGSRLGILFVDLDGFKVVNDTLGHAAGDRVLVRVANRIRSNVREEDTAARFGGDEFIVLLEDVKTREEVVRMARRLIRAFNEPVSAEGRNFSLQLSVGLVVTDPGPDADIPEPDVLVQRADMAMFRAKELGGSRFHVVELDEETEPTRRQERKARLQAALEGDEFRLHYQPIVHLSDGGVVGVEPLARWDRGDGELVQPADFIPLAEETGLIVPLGEVLLLRACRQLEAWDRELPGEPMRLHPNLSVQQLEEPGLLETVAVIVEEEGIDAGRIVFELTESEILQAPEVTEGLKEMGAGVLVDDFGTGYSSLTHLRELPVDGVKLDMSLVHALGRNPEIDALTEAIVRLCRKLELVVVAEGIETRGQARALWELGCLFGQGRHFAPALPREEVADRIAAGFSPA